MKSVLISIQPKWCEKIVNGEKTIEVRKTAPDAPFKCYIYESRNGGHRCKHCNEKDSCYSYAPKNVGCYNGRGRVIGEFVCDKVFLLHPYTYDGGSADLGHRKFIQTFEGSSKDNEILSATCLSQDEMFDYIGVDNYGYGWHISDLKIYDKPKELSEFRGLCKVKTACHNCPHYNYSKMDCDSRVITRAPQSWQYVEE